MTTSKFLKGSKSLTGFSFTSTDTPAEVFGNSNFYPTTLVNTSVVYSGAPFSDTGFTITKMRHTVPDPPRSCVGQWDGPTILKTGAAISLRQAFTPAIWRLL